MGDPAAYFENRSEAMRKVKERSPTVGRAFAPFFKELMKEGELSVKQKELIAVGISIALRCESCIYSHVERCMKAGASGAEIMEATEVAVMMQGGPAYTYTPIVAAAVEYVEQNLKE